ncbi:M14 family metallopeptidase [Pseudoalteromonas sp. T1lg23B]|uniref:M14 family metallopeptidase n=1 Tax=Pseudoalteromonas sp. T1lg23B TaxID=2077097 RepID=UPI000CF6924D|nr:M14-type cytosolic carboxypeptidase [Pseudoalteromonas sp. T1lg23B]
MITIHSDFESGSIEVINASNAENIELNISKDNQACTRQWFYFAIESSHIEPQQITLRNAAKVSFVNAWQGYQVFASYNNVDWFRVATQYQNEQLIIRHEVTEHIVYYAYFVPYSLARQHQLNDKLLQNPHVISQEIGQSTLGESITLLRIGDHREQTKKVWLIARQHPGETMAQWIIDGLLNHYFDNATTFARQFTNIEFFVVANMNPDGCKLGNHRTNAQGVNLNRQWQDPNAASCPEVSAVKQAMESYGVDLFIDIHGDEQLPYNFMMVEGHHPMGETLKRSLHQLYSNFQIKYDYDTPNDDANDTTVSPCCGCAPKAYSTATQYVYQHFGVAAILLEASFKPLAGKTPAARWDHHDCQQLGARLLHAIAATTKAWDHSYTNAVKVS